jgi:hypothetical protein
MAETYQVNEEVEYKSHYDGEWRKGIISRFTEDGLTLVACIWEQPEGYKYPFCNHVPLNKEYIRKEIRRI